METIGKKKKQAQSSGKQSEQTNIYQRIMGDLGLKSHTPVARLPLKPPKQEKSFEQFRSAISFHQHQKPKEPRKTFKQVVQNQKTKFYKTKGEPNNKKFNILRKLKVKCEGLHPFSQNNY